MISEKYVDAAGAGAHDGSSAANAFSWAEMVTDINAGSKAGNRYNYTGAISRTTTTDTISGSGTVTSPVVIRGCSSLASIGDGYLGRTNGNGPLITTNMPGITYTTGNLVISGSFILLESLNVAAASVARAMDLTGSNNVARGCKAANSGTNAASAAIVASGTNTMVFDCDGAFTGASGGTAAIRASGANSKVIACRATGGVTVGILCSSTSVVLVNVAYASTVGIAMNATSGTPTIFGNDCVGCSVDGIDIITGTTSIQCIVNNMLTDNTGNGLDMVSTANAALLANTRTRDNGTAIGNGGDWITATNFAPVTTDTGGPETDYVNAGANDYSLIAASPATSAGIPSYASIGALQRDQTGSGGGGPVGSLIINPFCT